MNSYFVIAMGISTVFIGLICIILMCKILGALCAIVEKSSVAPSASTASVAAPAPAAAPTAPAVGNRQEVIAAIGAAIAEEAGVSVDAIRIVSIKRI